jgi:predicted transcriptional regulator
MLNIDKLKEVTGLSQTQIAQTLNVSTTFISEAKTKTAFWMQFVKTYEKKFGKQLPITKFIKDEN